MQSISEQIWREFRASRTNSSIVRNRCSVTFRASSGSPRWGMFLAAILSGILTTSPGVAATPDKRPNLVLIVIDDFGWTDLRCYGSKFYRTPNVDRLAVDGMRFTQAYAACPVCSPTRAALMTGRYPARLHLTDYIPGQGNSPARRLLRAEFRQELPLNEVTLAELLRPAGYATASIGKWHLGGEGFEATRQGFDVCIAGDASGSPARYFAPYLTRDGNPMIGLEQAPPGQYLTDRLTTEAEKFIDANHDRPFFLYLPHYAVHTPLMAKRDLIGAYETGSKSPGQQNNPVYAAMIESVDESVGRIVAKLEALSLTDNTIVIFTSDNGGLVTSESKPAPATSNAPLREGKGYLYEGGIRVPLVVKWPAAIRANSTTNVATSSIDLWPTMAEICDVAPPVAVDGVSLAGVWRQTGQPAARPLFWHYPHYSPQGGKPGGAMREGDFKLIEFYEQGRRELYNVSQDISESTNLADRAPQRVEQMAAQLALWRRAVGAQMTRPNPDFVPERQAANGTLTLSGDTAMVHGMMLRYEPQVHKQTLGFWTRADDWASWEFQIDRPGTFQLEILQGCGPGSGGSVVDFMVGDQTITATVEATSGFQDFVARRLGVFALSAPGRYTLAVKPRTKPGPAVMDLREVKLVPMAQAGK